MLRVRDQLCTSKARPPAPSSVVECLMRLMLRRTTTCTQHTPACPSQPLRHAAPTCPNTPHGAAQACGLDTTQHAPQSLRQHGTLQTRPTTASRVHGADRGFLRPCMTSRAVEIQEKARRCSRQEEHALAISNARRSHCPPVGTMQCTAYSEKEHAVLWKV